MIRGSAGDWSMIEPIHQASVRSAETEILIKARRFDRFSSTVPALLYEYRIEPDGTRKCLYCSPYSEILLGVPAERLVDDITNFLDLIHPDDRERFDDADREANRRGDLFIGEFRVVLAGGEEKWIRIGSRCSHPEGGQSAIWSGYMVDITPTRRLEEQLRERATHDDLTGLCNRREFQARFEDEQARMRRHGRSGAVLLMDLDHFKHVNDDYGHDAGDFVLREVSARILACLREVDTLARWGGEEFSVLMPATGAAGAMLAAQRILDVVGGQAFHWNGGEIRLTISIGITALTDPADRLEQVISRADQALYRAKRGGRNRAEQT